MPEHRQPPAHLPEMLYIGCVDARLDPIDDIGIEKGTALIFRNIAALVPEYAGDVSSGIAPGEITDNTSIGAVLEFFLDHIPPVGGDVKHIVVSGHTDCGGIKACRHNACRAQDHYLSRYLGGLKGLCATILAEAEKQGWDEAQILRALEEASVRQSITNLMHYPVVRRALDAQKVEIHGWLIDTAVKRIFEMHPATKEFLSMAEFVNGEIRPSQSAARAG